MKKIRITVISVLTFLVVLIIILVGIRIAIYLNSDLHYAKKLEVAIEEENISKVQKIIEKRPTCINTVPAIMPKWFHTLVDSPRPMYSLAHACEKDNVEIVKVLIDAGADLNGVEERFPLELTLHRTNENCFTIAQLLIENGATTNYKSKSDILFDLAFASEPTTIERVMTILRYALEDSENNNINLNRGLGYCVKFDEYEMVKYLLDEGYCGANDIFAGMTALMHAAKSSTPEMVQLLLDYGADKKCRSEEGKTAYDYAVEEGNSAVLPLLLN